MKLAVFGANGPTGRLLTQLALDEHHDVMAFTRHPDDFPIEHRRLEIVAGDVHDAAAVASAIEGTDTVVSTLGVPFAKTPITVYPDGATNIIAGMHAADIKRLVCVTSSAVDPHPAPLGGFVFEKIMQPYVVNKLGKTLYDDMRRMEALVAGRISTGRSCDRRDCSKPPPSPSTASRSTPSGTGSPLGSTWRTAFCVKQSTTRTSDRRSRLRHRARSPRC
jgi:NAD(P)H-binding